MSKTKGSEAAKPKATKRSKPRGPRRKDALDRAINAFEASLEKKNVTVGEYVRLVQLQKEIDGDEPKDIKVTWVEQGETESSEE